MPDSHVKFHSANDKRLLLIVEDEAVNRELLGLVLQDDYEVAFATDGGEGLKAVSEGLESLSLILLDLNLPDMHGMDTISSPSPIPCPA